MSDELGFEFDATTYVPVPSQFSLLPIGDYTAMIVKSSFGPTAAGNGQVAKLELDILEGQHKGRKIFSNLCLKHANPQTENIANAHFQELLLALGKERTNRLSVLHNIPLTVKVTLSQDKKTGKDQNNYSFKKLGGGDASPPRQQAQYAPPPQNTAPSAPPASRPWQK